METDDVFELASAITAQLCRLCYFRSCFFFWCRYLFYFFDELLLFLYHFGFPFGYTGRFNDHRNWLLHKSQSFTLFLCHSKSHSSSLHFFGHLNNDWLIILCRCVNLLVVYLKFFTDNLSSKVSLRKSYYTPKLPKAFLGCVG